MESQDYTLADFNNTRAYVHFNPSLEYYNSGSWVGATSAASYNAFALSTVNVHFTCDPPFETAVSSTYAPPTYTTN